MNFEDTRISQSHDQIVPSIRYATTEQSPFESRSNFSLLHPSVMHIVQVMSNMRVLQTCHEKHLEHPMIPNEQRCGAMYTCMSVLPGGPGCGPCICISISGRTPSAPGAKKIHVDTMSKDGRMEGRKPCQIYSILRPGPQNILNLEKRVFGMDLLCPGARVIRCEPGMGIFSIRSASGLPFLCCAELENLGRCLGVACKKELPSSSKESGVETLYVV